MAMATVKQAGSRAQKTRQTRRRMLQAAQELFVERGYGATTLQDVADRAGVAVQTIYFTFGNKRTLLKEVVDVTIAGDDEPVATVDRKWFRDALAAPTAADQLAAYVAGTRAVLDRFAAIYTMVVTAVAIDRELSALWPQNIDLRHIVNRTAAESLMTKPGARADVPVERAADLLYGLLSPNLYLLFVCDRGWSPAQFEEWARETLRSQLLD